jgi:hypothetical protein
MEIVFIQLSDKRREIRVLEHAWEDRFCEFVHVLKEILALELEDEIIVSEIASRRDGLWTDSLGKQLWRKLKTDLDDKAVTLGAPGHDMGECMVF